MRSLIEYITGGSPLNESKGVVTGEHSWSAACTGMAAAVFKDPTLYDETDPDYQPKFYNWPLEYCGWNIEYTGKDLPDWCASVFICIHTSRYDKVFGDCALFDGDNSIMGHGKLRVSLIFSQTFLQSIDKADLATFLEHEMSHAFDRWISETRGGAPFLGYPTRLGKLGDIKNMSFRCFYLAPKQANLNSFIDLLNQYTYITHPSEIKAYLREFKLALDNRSIPDWNDLISEPALQNIAGYIPLQWYRAFYAMKGIYKDILSDTDLDILFYGTEDWFKEVFGKTFGYADPWNRLEHIIEYMDAWVTKHVLTEYRRVYRSCGYTLPNIPKYLQ